MRSRSTSVLATAAAIALGTTGLTIAVAAPAAPTTAGTTTVRINSGAGKAEVNGKIWAADRYAAGGRAENFGRTAVAGTSADTLYRTARTGMKAYHVPVASGSYRVTLHFTELVAKAPNKRVFTVAGENAVLIRDLDLFKAAGRGHAVTVTRYLQVTGGSLDLRFAARKGQATVSAIEIVPGTAPAPTASSSAVSARFSGLPWASGVFVAGMEPSTYARFASWRGRALDVAVLWSARQSWADVENPGWLYSWWSSTPYTKVIGVAPVPEGVRSATLATCASGRDNAHWVNFAKNIKAAGMDSSIIRLGWEMNGDWYKWSASNPKQFAQCWRQIVTTAERIAPKLRWDFTVTRGPGQSVRDARAAYPGDKFVDFVGVDSYDMYPGVKSEAAWQQHLNGAYGLKFWADFARAHHKKLSVPEWGVYPGSASGGSNGGDNALYISKMIAFFKANRDVLGYEAYFNEPASYYAGALYPSSRNPRAAKAYRTGYAR